jgi:hypothetical protein
MRGLLEAALGGSAKNMHAGGPGFMVGDGAGIGNPALGAQYFPWGPAGVFGRPGTAESLIPLWGSIRSLLNHLYEGRLGWAAADALFVGLDLTIVGKLLTEPLKLGVRDFLRSEAAAATEEGAKAVGGKGVQAGAAELGKAADAGEKAAQEAARAAELAGKPKPRVELPEKLPKQPQPPKTRRLFDEHHPIPKFLGGLADQAMPGVLPEVHRQFHSLLLKYLRETGLRWPFGGTIADWARFMNQNPGAFKTAMDAVLRASRAIDAKHGTKLTQWVWENLMLGKFLPFP